MNIYFLYKNEVTNQLVTSLKLVGGLVASFMRFLSLLVAKSV